MLYLIRTYFLALNFWAVEMSMTWLRMSLLSHWHKPHRHCDWSHNFANSCVLSHARFSSEARTRKYHCESHDGRRLCIFSCGKAWKGPNLANRDPGGQLCRIQLSAWVVLFQLQIPSQKCLAACAGGAASGSLVVVLLLLLLLLLVVVVALVEY